MSLCVPRSKTSRLERSQISYGRPIIWDELSKTIIEETKRVAVEAIKLSSRKSVHKLATNEIRPPVRAAVND